MSAERRSRGGPWALAPLAFAAGCTLDLSIGELAPEAGARIETPSRPTDAGVADAGRPDVPAEAGVLDAGTADLGLADSGRSADATHRPDANTSPLALDPTARVECIDDLAGQETAFLGLTPADLGIGDGPVELVPDGDGYLFAAPAFAGALGAGVVRLEPDPGVPDVYYGGRMFSPIAGPLSTVATAAVIVVELAYEPVPGEVQFQFARDPYGACLVGFAFEIAAP